MGDGVGVHGGSAGGQSWFIVAIVQRGQREIRKKREERGELKGELYAGNEAEAEG